MTTTDPRSTVGAQRQSALIPDMRETQTEYRPGERLYCVTVRVVDLVWATSEEDAVSQLSQAISGNRCLDVDVIGGLGRRTPRSGHRRFPGDTMASNLRELSDHVLDRLGHEGLSKGKGLIVAALLAAASSAARGGHPTSVVLLRDASDDEEGS